MTKAETVSVLAEKSGMTRIQVEGLLDALASLAYAEAKNGFSVPGIGKLVLVQRAARAGRNPATGATIQIPARTAVKFRVASACKEAVLKA